LTKVLDGMKAEDKKELVKVEEAIGKYCETTKNEKEIKLCYYVDPIKREVSQPVKNGAPISVICSRLKKKSAEICSLRYSSAPAVNSGTVKVEDLAKLRIKDLKALMAEKGLTCPECIEKEDFVAKLTAAFGGKQEL
jgi:hypothetical protein